jgi:hypothetical protein
MALTQVLCDNVPRVYSQVGKISAAMFSLVGLCTSRQAGPMINSRDSRWYHGICVVYLPLACELDP